MPQSANPKPDAVPAEPDWVPIEELLDYKIGQLRKMLDRYSSPIVSEQFGLSLAEWRMLTHIQVGASVTPNWLRQRLNVDRAEVSRASASLIRRGYISNRPHPDDRRSVLLELTEAGKAIYRQIMPIRQELQRELTAALDPKELAVLHQALDKLTEAVAGKIDKAAAPDRRRS